MVNKSELRIGDEVYYNHRFSSKDCSIGKIVGETHKYWKIKFENSEPDLFSKDNLYKRGGGTWDLTIAYPLTKEKKEQILFYRKKKCIEKQIYEFFRNSMYDFKTIEQGEKILGLIDEIKNVLSNSTPQTKTLANANPSEDLIR